MGEPLASSRESIEQTASEWLVRRDSGRFSETDQRSLESWLSQSSRHAVAYYRLEAAWTASDRLKVLGAGSLRPESLARPQHRDRGRAALSFAGAAAASVLVTFGLFYALGQRAFHGYRFATPVGRVATLPLADGSWITLNTDSVIRIALTPTVRRVDLERGEAFFDVAKDRNRPFIVVAGGKSVTAVGTEFSVRREGAITRVTVAEGKVRFSTLPAIPATSVAAGHIAEAGLGGQVAVQETPMAEVEGSLSWRQGYVVFHDASIDQAVTDLNRYNDRKLHVVNPAMGDTKISGAIRTDNIDGFARMMKDEVPLEIIGEESSGAAVQPPMRPINVPAGDLVSALENIVRQPRVQFLYRRADLQGLQTSGASGCFTGPQALANLVQGTSASTRVDSSGAVLTVAARHHLGPY